jgi:hypothetical protein
VLLPPPPLSVQRRIRDLKFMCRAGGRSYHVLDPESTDHALCGVELSDALQSDGESQGGPTCAACSQRRSKRNGRDAAQPRAEKAAISKPRNAIRARLAADDARVKKAKKSKSGIAAPLKMVGGRRAKPARPSKNKNPSRMPPPIPEVLRGVTEPVPQTSKPAPSRPRAAKEDRLRLLAAAEAREPLPPESGEWRRRRIDSAGAPGLGRH